MSEVRLVGAYLVPKHKTKWTRLVGTREVVTGRGLTYGP